MLNNKPYDLLRERDAAARNKIRAEAYGIISMTPDKRISNRSLAKALRMDPRGLRQVIERDDHFMIELRGEDYRTEPWYSINPAHPPLIMDEREPPRLNRLIAGKCPAITKEEP